ncbi:nuclear speckle splicing regulatory protein 1 isoform X2 [Cyclopterus lumpus]|nr:nuclear speckle splicing regulatory protein 1 isoform X2 [Cyclopterus lumpus]XP_034407036.1 nuclear speckle splicing regulatory protein 1 isoform X2 [Cyclopterus lumpus]XP_034407037.1 nuclear speckle splicing regulatory protein 1 isoform X2 [Cyclopterus lumpus]XP_034407039.1 nuclear speckle splicing regulatory protein 1 isoform X2 [Cyclopterus lumpus]XP_034407040.1 nuclear speckle splicing regulatory protein 1 isoform X2 [Cyclopterus lumpus]XP_034407041.1 nuclear speckle splicing regulatory
MKQTRLAMHKALEQDSTVYDYDGVYDDIQKQRLESNKKILGGADKKPKYIHQLMRAVEDRKKEQERRDERKIQKEREEEGEEFADKEAYVTSAYKLKLQEQKEEQEREKRVDAMEAALDVKKQKDLSGFYRHLLNQTVGEEAIPDCSAKTQNSKLSKDTERTSPVPVPTSQDIIPSSGSDSEEGHEQKSGFSKPGVGSAHSKRQYRQRSPSSVSGEEKEKEKERERHKKRHRDQDRDRNRGRERDDRHGGRRDDRDGRKDRDRGREDDRSRGKDADREDRHVKRERSPKEKEKDKNGEREKRRNQDEDRRKDKDLEEEKERKKQPENEKAVKSDGKDLEKDPEKKEAVGEQVIKKIDEQKEKGEENEENEEKANKFVKRSTDQTVSSARDRYMSRQIARSSCKTYIEKEED